MLRALLSAALLLLHAPDGQGHQDDQPSAEQVKAVFLFNFAQFVEWPATALGEANTPLSICILGDDPFGPFLDATVRGESVRGHQLRVQRHQSVADARRCHILYISRSEAARLPDIFRSLRGRPILTVGDGPEFARRGGVIAFAIVRNRIRLRINTSAAQAAGISISSKLLHVADVSSEGPR